MMMTECFSVIGLPMFDGSVFQTARPSTLVSKSCTRYHFWLILVDKWKILPIADSVTFKICVFFLLNLNTCGAVSDANMATSFYIHSL